MTIRVSTQLRIRDEKTWEAFKELAEKRHLSANALLNVLIEQELSKASEPIAPPAFL